MNYKFNIFGSENSIDCDVAVNVEQMPPTIEQCKDLCKFYDVEIAKKLNTDKEVNSNLVIVRDGIITNCFKGNSVENNNSIFLTHALHKQSQSCMVEKQLPITNEWILLKSARAMRIILSLLSRTQYRPEVKKALKGSTRIKMGTILTIDLSTIDDFGKNNLSKDDVFKIIAFQIGQTLGLLELPSPIELYTKNDVGLMFNKLKPFLNRNSISKEREDLTQMKDMLIYKIINYMHINPFTDYDLELIKE